MITLQQIRALESKVNKAVELIDRLRKENKALKTSLDTSQTKIRDLEKLVQSFKDDQEEIESAILDTIKKLERLEDEVAGVAPRSDASAVTSSSGASAGTGASARSPRSPAGKDRNPSGEAEKDDADDPDKELDIF